MPEVVIKDEEDLGFLQKCSRMMDYKVDVGEKSRQDRMDELGGSRRPRTGEEKER